MPSLPNCTCYQQLQRAHLGTWQPALCAEELKKGSRKSRAKLLFSWRQKSSFPKRAAANLPWPRAWEQETIAKLRQPLERGMLLRAISPRGTVCQRLRSQQPCLRCMAQTRFWHLACSAAQPGQERDGCYLPPRPQGTLRGSAQAPSVEFQVAKTHPSVSFQPLRVVKAPRGAGSASDRSPSPPWQQFVPAASPLDLGHPCFPPGVAPRLPPHQHLPISDF